MRISPQQRNSTDLAVHQNQLKTHGRNTTYLQVMGGSKHTPRWQGNQTLVSYTWMQTLWERRGNYTSCTWWVQPTHSCAEASKKRPIPVQTHTQNGTKQHTTWGPRRRTGTARSRHDILQESRSHPETRYRRNYAAIPRPLKPLTMMKTQAMDNMTAVSAIAH